MKEAGNTSKKKDRPGEAKMDDEERHRFLAYLMPQLEPLRQACERNFVTQAGLIALACSHLYSNSTPTVFGLTFPNEVLNIVFPLVLTYLVIRMGYLINAYIFIRTGITTALKVFDNRTQEFQDDNAERMLRANSLVELFCLEYKRKPFSARNAALVILPLILSAIFALNHILVLFYLRRIYGYQPSLAILLAIVLGLPMTACYVHYIFTPKQRGATLIAKATILLSVAGVAGFLILRKLV